MPDSSETTESFETNLKVLDLLLTEVVKSSEIQSKEVACRVKSMISRNLGVLNSKHGLASSSGRQIKRANR